VLRTSRAIRSGYRRPCPCRSSETTRRAALRAGSRLCTWTQPRPFYAPFPPTAPSSGAYPLTPVFLPCGAVAPRTGRGIMCHGIGGQGAWQPSLRSGRLRRPARAEWDNSRRRTPCPQCLVLVRRGRRCLLVVTALSHPLAVSRPLSSRGEAPPSIRGTKRAGRIVLRSWTLITACS